jgi:uncharacterized protein with HEPN domain
LKRFSTFNVTQQSAGKPLSRTNSFRVGGVRHLQIIGEAARALPDEIRNSIPEIPWSKIIGMRHVLVHNYFGIDTELAWKVVESELDPLRSAIESFLKQPPG